MEIIQRTIPPAINIQFPVIISLIVYRVRYKRNLSVTMFFRACWRRKVLCRLNFLLNLHVKTTESTYNRFTVVFIYTILRSNAVRSLFHTIRTINLQSIYLPRSRESLVIVAFDLRAIYAWQCCVWDASVGGLFAINALRASSLRSCGYSRPLNYLRTMTRSRSKRSHCSYKSLLLRIVEYIRSSPLPLYDTYLVVKTYAKKKKNWIF